MSISLVQRFFAFFGNVWSFMLTLVRSLLALFSFRRRSSDPPILLTPRAVALSPGRRSQRAPSTRTPSATSTLFLGHDQHARASGSVPLTSGSAPQRTSPKLDPHDPELGLSSNTPTASDHTGPSIANATSFGEGTTDASSLTTPIGCYLAPMPSATDCPYVDPLAVDRGKLRLPGSPLKVSINADPAYAETMIRPIGSPPPRHWSPAQIWTSTPFKTGRHGARSGPPRNTLEPTTTPPTIQVRPLPGTRSPTRSTPTIPTRPHTSRTSRTSPILTPNSPPPIPICAHGAATLVSPAKPHTYPRSRSHTDLGAREHGWYDADAYLPSPNPALSPPLASPSDSGDDDEPLGWLKARLIHRRTAVSASIGYGLPYADVESPRTRRRRSEGCLLAMLASSPTPIGLGACAQLDADYTKDWLEALSLHAAEAGPF
ncbi:hypothetical protein JVU11DRAFT_4490 [Chiua virens]|nr:hypothetical protein JVU11DRAFT_4490 [Chiua virens]